MKLNRWSLFTQLVKRDVEMRYRGSVLGLLWALLIPLVMLAIYYFVFGMVFKARGFETNADGEFALYLFSGLMLHGFFAECLNAGPVLISNQPNLVKKVVFPLRMLAPVAVVSAGIHLLISIAILLVATFILTGQIHITALWLPVVLLPFVVFVVGMTWFLSSFGVYLPDIRQTTGFIATAMLFLSPIFYSLDQLSPKLQQVIMLNPLSVIVENTRLVMLKGEAPIAEWMLIYTVISVAVAAFGMWWFTKTRRGFADVL